MFNNIGLFNRKDIVITFMLGQSDSNKRGALYLISEIAGSIMFKHIG